MKIFYPLLVLFPLSAFAQELDLDNYLIEVQTKNGGVRGTQISAEAKNLRRDEGSLFFRPSFFLTGEYMDDQRPTTAPAFQGSQTLRHTLRAGLSQNFRTGTKASLSYNYYKTQINGASPALLPNSMFFDVAPTLEVTQSLWRNFLGTEFEANEVAQNSANEAQKYQEEFSYKQLMMQAKNAYWRLYFTQQSLKVQKESLDRAIKLRDWNQGRVRSNLVDEAELLQAEASLQNRELDYQDTLTELATAEREFNSFRESEEKVNLRANQDIENKYILNATLPEKAEIREDVLAVMAQNKALIAQSEIGNERNKPNLELYGSYAMNGRDKQYADSRDQAFSNTKPMSVVGVRFVTPLDFGSLSDYRKSYAQDKMASEMKTKRKTFEVEREWEILTERFQNFKSRLKLTQKLEKAQEKKLLTEKRRYNQGRTTTFQVLQFEQDFANAQLLKLRNERELIVVYNQLMLFAGDKK
ncbi:MAG: TolC family protein [Bdellovibrionota bacterium]